MTPPEWPDPTVKRVSEWPDDYPDADEAADDVILEPADTTATMADPVPVIDDEEDEEAWAATELPAAQLTGNAEVDRVIGTLRQVASRPPADQVDTYELAHQQLRETLSSIDRAGQG